MVRRRPTLLFHAVVLVICLAHMTGCVTYRSAFGSLEEVQDGQSIVFGEFILYRAQEDGALERAQVVDNKIKVTVISRATSEFLYYDINTKEDLFHWNLYPGRYTLAQAKFAPGGTCRIFTDFEVSDQRPLSYIGSLGLVLSGNLGRYRLFVMDREDETLDKLRSKFPGLKGEPTTDLMISGDKL